MITILLDQTAIEEALTNYIGETTLGVDLSQKDISIKLIAGRGENGLRAEVSIAPQGEGSDPEADVPFEPENDAAPEDAATESEEKVVDAPDFFDDND
jgi:hypothetical protein